MKDEHGTQHYSVLEEKTNVVSHAIGLILSFVALVLMVIKASSNGDALDVISAAIFGLSLIALYASSTIYHSATDLRKRARLRVLDHATIYVLIAGTYTPITLLGLTGWAGWSIFGISWAMALTGVILKLFYTGRFSVLSTLMYVFMGWVIMFAIKPLINNMSPDGLFWLVAGGVAYTTGAIIYSIKKVPFNHAIFHLFVMLGSFCHFVSVYFYVLP
jgi:hemolysin III